MRNSLLPDPPISYAKADFLTASCNAQAHAWLENWPDWPLGASSVRGLILCGPTACGKSHLAKIWANRTKAHYYTITDLPSSAANAWVIEDIDHRVMEEAIPLFHLYEHIGIRTGFLLATTRTPPSSWPCGILPDLVSRLSTLTCVRIDLPDTAMMRGLLVKLFSDRQLYPSPAVISYLIRRLDRRFSNIRSIVTALDVASLEAHCEITIPLARTVLDAQKIQIDLENYETS